MKLNLQLIENIKLKLPPVPKGCLQVFEDKDKTYLLADEYRYIHIYEYNTQDLKSVYKSDAQEAQISSISISDDLIFYNTGAEIRAMTFKGKQVFSFDTCLAESIQKILVAGYRLFVNGNTILNQFMMADTKLSNNKSRKIPPTNKKTEDIAMLVSQDDINDVIIYSDLLKEYALILRNNNQLQLISQGKPVSSYKTQGIPLCAEYIQKQDKSRFLIGLSVGSVLCLQILSQGNNFTFKQKWNIPPSDKKVSGVISFPKGIILNRSNQLQIWCQQQGQYERIWKKTLKEPVINFTYITKSDEIICCNMNGQIIGLSNYEKQIKQNKEKGQERKQSNVRAQKDIQMLQDQKNKLLSKRQIVPKYKIKHSMTLNQTKRCWIFSIQCSLPITNVVFYGIKTSKSSYKLQYISKDQQPQSQVYSIANMNQVQFQIINSEGLEKLAQVFVSLKSNPPQATTILLQLKPLCLHAKISNTLPQVSKDMHRMSVTGYFNRSQMNMWLLSIFSETVKSIPDNEIVLVYESVLTKQKIVMVLIDKKLEIESQSINPLLIIKKFLQLRSKQKQIPVTFDIMTNKNAVQQSLKLFQPSILKLQKVQRQHKILSELVEMQSQTKLSSTFRQILSRREQIEQQYKNGMGTYNELKQNLLLMYLNYKSMHNQQLGEIQIQNFKRKMNEFNFQQIKKLII